MMFEGTCDQCGTLNCFHTLESTKCKQVVGNKICQGFPTKIFEVHTTMSGLQAAMVDRLASPNKGWPTLKFRPVDSADINVSVTEDRVKYPSLAKLLNW